MSQFQIERFGKYLCQYKDGILINKWESACEAVRQTGFGKGLICRVARHNEISDKKHFAYGYMWVYEKRDQ